MINICPNRIKKKKKQWDSIIKTSTIKINRFQQLSHSQNIKNQSPHQVYLKKLRANPRTLFKKSQ